jgi:hypothetical protein
MSVKGRRSTPEEKLRAVQLLKAGNNAATVAQMFGVSRAIEAGTGWAATAHAHELGIRAGLVAGDEVYGSLGLRRPIRERGTGYVLAVRSDYRVTLSPGRRLTVKNAAGLVKPGM